MDTPITRAEHEEFRRNMEAEHKRLHHRVDALEEAVTESNGKISHLEQSDAKKDVQYGQIMETLGSVKADLSELKGKPVRRWEAVVDKVLLGLIGAVVVYIASQIGL